MSHKALLLAFFCAAPLGGAILTGQVTDPDGAALPGAQVWVAGEDFEHPWPDQPAAVSGPDGGFTVSGLPSEGLRIAVCRAGSSPRIVQQGRVPDETLAVVLAPAARLAGRVVDPEGRPLAKARVGVFLAMRHDTDEPSPSPNDVPPCPTGEETALTDGEGRFSLAPLAPDLYVFAVDADGFVPLRVPDTEVRREGQADLVAEMKRGASLSGRITDPRGRPIEGATVTTFLSTNDAETDADGRYRLEGIEPGINAFYFLRQGYDQIGGEATQILPGENTLDARLTPLRGWDEVDEGGGRTTAAPADPEPEPAPRPQAAARFPVSGRALDADGAPVPGIELSFLGHSKLAYITTRSDGTFEIPLPDGTYTVSTQARTLAQDDLSVVVAGAPVLGLEVRLNHAVNLTVYVTGLAPREVRDLLLWKWGGSYRLPQTPDGVYSVRDICPGTWKVTVERTGERDPESVEVEVDGVNDRTLEVRWPDGPP
jgi:hypothetical protein